MANHPTTYHQYGFSRLHEGYGGFRSFEVDFLSDFESHHDAGHNIICYDLRSHGISVQDSSGLGGALGQYESRDVVQSIIYHRSGLDTKKV